MTLNPMVPLTLGQARGREGDIEPNGAVDFREQKGVKVTLNSMVPLTLGISITFYFSLEQGILTLQIQILVGCLFRKHICL